MELTPFHSWLVDLRRDLHRIPELAFEEHETARKIAEVLTGLGVPFKPGVGKTGIVAWLDAHNPGPTLAMRADMDALPITEPAEVPWRSLHEGMMHACGHDGHVTVALGVVRWLVDSGWREQGRGRMLFFFQPGEEGGAGARLMLESGVADSERVEAIFAGHMHPELPTGHIGIAREECNAASDSLHIRLKGKGGHGAQPHFCSDPIVAGAYLITQLQTIVSRNVPPLESAVITIGRFNAGTKSNIIPEFAELRGTLRTLKPQVRNMILERLKETMRGIGEANRVAIELDVLDGYPILVNNKGLVEFAATRAERLLGRENVHLEGPRMGAEDFAYFARKWPGVFIRLGCTDPEKEFVHGLHSPYFSLDERALDVGVRLFAEFLTTYLPTS